MEKQRRNSHDECRCSHTEAFRVNPHLPIGSAGLCTPSSSRSLTAEVIEVKCYTKLNESLADDVLYLACRSVTDRSTRSNRSNRCVYAI